MFAVIFKAEINHLDKEYFATVEKMRDIANSKYEDNGDRLLFLSHAVRKSKENYKLK